MGRPAILNMKYISDNKRVINIALEGVHMRRVCEGATTAGLRMPSRS